MSTQEQGKVILVAVRHTGSELVEDVPAGTTELLVEDAYDFSEDGGQLSIGADVLTYIDVDEDTDTLMLAAPTAVPYEAGDPVRMEPPSSETVASVVLADGGAAIEARVPHTMTHLLEEGPRNDATAETVALILDDDEWVLSDVVGLQARPDAGMLRGTVPVEALPPSGPTQAPDVAPDISAAPFAIGTVRVTITPLRPELEARYEIAASLASPVPEDGSATVATVPGTVFDLASIAGAPIPYGTPARVKVRATNAIGSGPWSAEVAAAPRQIDELDVPDFVLSVKKFRSLTHMIY